MQGYDRYEIIFEQPCPSGLGVLTLPYKRKENFKLLGI